MASPQRNPKISKGATFLAKISVAEMKTGGLQGSILEAAARYVHELQIVNGLAPGKFLPGRSPASPRRRYAKSPSG